MNYANLEFYSVVELESAAGGGLAMRRFPKAVREALSPLGRIVSQESAGCEIRFVTEAESLRLAVSVQPSPLAPYELNNLDLFIFKGAFFHSHVRLEPGKVNPIHLTDITGDVKKGFESLKPAMRDTDYFSSNVWRVLFGRYAAVFHELDTYGYAVRPPLEVEKPRRRMLCYGSSITNGASPTGYHLSYVQQAARHLKADVFNQGLSGACMCEPEMADYLAARDDWDIITLELGVNMRGTFTPEEFESRSRYLIETVSGAHPNKPVFLITVYPNAESPENAAEPSELQARQSAYCEILRTIAAENRTGNLHLIEGADVLTDYSGMTKDLIHPGDYGHTEMGLNLARIIKRNRQMEA
jgi:lysophospholipase L1-like esterase